MRFLVAVACLVIIAAGGLYLWREYRQYEQEQAVAAEREAAMKELFEVASAEATDVDKVKRWCGYLIVRTQDAERDERTQRLIRNCRSFGFL